MKKLDTDLNGEFIISSCKLLFLLFFISALSYSVVIFGTFSFICLAQTMTSSLLHKSNLMFISKEATNRVTSLKMIISIKNIDRRWKQAETEKILDKVGFFEDQTADFIITKASFLENTLIYTNHGSVTPVKGKLAIYLD